MKYLYTLSYRVPNETVPREYGFDALSDKSAAAKARGMLWGVNAYGVILVNMQSETRNNLLEGYDPEGYPLMTTRSLLALIFYYLVIASFVATIFWLALGRAGGVQ